jgi:hypothetical protein
MKSFIDFDFIFKYLMDYARELNPNFYILGELFTNSETLDNVFINKLGINALVRGRYFRENRKKSFECIRFD